MVPELCRSMTSDSPFVVWASVAGVFDNALSDYLWARAVLLIGVQACSTMKAGNLLIASGATHSMACVVRACRRD